MVRIDSIDVLRRHWNDLVIEELRLLDHLGLITAIVPFGEEPRDFVSQSLTRYVDAVGEANAGAPGREEALDAIHHMAVLTILERHGADPAAALALARALAGRAVERQAEALKREAADMKAADLRLGGTIAHDLRSPLTALNGALNVLARCAASPEGGTAQRMTEIAVGSGKRLLRLVDGLLDADRLANGEPLLALERCDMGDVLGEVAAMMAGAAAAGDVTLAILPSRAPLRADAERLRQALVQLLGSAISASAPGGLVRLSAGCHTGECVLRLAVESAWPALEALTTPPSGALTKAELAQIELVAARMLIERHGGRVWTEGDMALGLALPLAEDEESPLVLVCDGDAGFETVVKAYLRPRGMRVAGVNGADALIEALGQRRPALVLLDDQAAAPEVLAALADADVPIVRMGVGGTEDAGRLIKPFKKAALLAAVDHALATPAGGAP